MAECEASGGVQVSDFGWINRIKRGDVLRSPSGKLRIVREVHHHDSGSINKTYVTFAIQRCSWTGRCFTVYTGNDLRGGGWRPVGASVKLNTKFDRLIQWEIVERPLPAEIKIHCCDVVGIA